MTDKIKKDTEFVIRTGFCRECDSNRYFYQHKSGGDWFCQLCNSKVYDEVK